MTISFKKRNYVNSDGLSLVYLFVNSKFERKRLNIDIHVDPSKWDKTKGRLNALTKEDEDINLMLDNIWSKVTKIKTAYRLSSKLLTIRSFVDEFNNEIPRGNFVSFYLKVLKDRKGIIHKSTYDKEYSIFRKLKSYKEEILFCDIDEFFFVQYRNHLARLGNNQTTRNGNIKVLKKYLRFATKAGIRLPVSLEDVKVGPTTGNRTYLNADEIKIFYDYYRLPFISKTNRLVMGYFLFSCFTGLRISDIIEANRDILITGKYFFKHVKTGKQQVININKKAMEILHFSPDLFVTKFTQKHIADTLRTMVTQFNLNKKVTFHVARHSFATNYIILGGNVVKLQQLLNHSDIKDTMVYVHLAEQEENKEADLLDSLF